MNEIISHFDIEFSIGTTVYMCVRYNLHYKSYQEYINPSIRSAVLKSRRHFKTVLWLQSCGCG